MTDRYPYRHHGPAVHGSKLTDYLISEANMIEDIEQLRAENARLREALQTLLDCPAISEVEFTGEWGCPDSDKAERQARAALFADPAPAVDGPDWEGFGRALMENWPTGDVEGGDLFDLSRKYRLIVEVPGGYDPEEHIDAEGICPEKGDPWFEYNFRGERQ